MDLPMMIRSLTLAPRGSVFRYFGADNWSDLPVPASIPHVYMSSAHRNVVCNCGTSTVADVPIAS
eukprot:CAMPEP_0201737278 /NCGR_PEP_ID=MMETSP0593-20130828/41978_1 /ASSEMBLY_ACC=CAM_ASM_000672 /TAXON_ID=267983 /ORGANISM="Skeletonema japonicum, Strain CCMP2506" /LENGTH=64 /DNA_ID=CAMNT_0048231233 /DNA_START=415 /DNA_END=605 /DNA_ORIENTATION=+